MRLRVLVSLVIIALAVGAMGCEGDVGGASAAAGTDPAGAGAGSAAPAVVVGMTPAQKAANEARVQAQLAADLAQRVESARAEFGKDVPLRVESGLFVLVAAERGVAFDEAADFAQRALDVYLGSFVARRPDRAVTVELVRTKAAFQRRCVEYQIRTCGDDLGAYTRRTRTIIANIGPGLPTLSHELIHPLVQTDFPRIPMWFDEGIGALFEKPVFDPPGEMHGANNWRYERLARTVRAAERAKAQVLPYLFTVRDDSLSDTRRDDIYSIARAFCQWLDERGQLWPFYRTWRDGVAEDPSGMLSFEQVTGMTLEQADATWIVWAKARTSR